VLRYALAAPLVVAVTATLIALGAVGTFGTLRQEFTPPEDRAGVRLRISAPSTVSLDFTQTQMQKIEDLLRPLRDAGEIHSDICDFGIRQLDQSRQHDSDLGAMG
jgi:HAE1 family hydrophobic/amphiphilic exporter-1